MPVKLQTPRKADQMIFLDILWSEGASLPTSKSSEFRKHQTKRHIKRKEKNPQNPGFLTHLHLLVYFLQSLVIFCVQLPALQPPSSTSSSSSESGNSAIGTKPVPSHEAVSTADVRVVRAVFYGISVGRERQESWEAHGSKVFSSGYMDA